MPKVSIIIAMYNIEEYIAYCINSCVNQIDVDPEDYEIIIVNDGATDRSLDVALDAIKGVSNARIITRQNGGLSAARNTGIENAKGKYLWFVDGDDAISPNALSVLISNIQSYNSDAYLINFSTFDGTKKIETSNFVSSNEMLSGKDYHFRQNRILPMMAWLTIYKSDVLKRHALTFMPNIIHEDLEFSIRAHHMSSSIVFIKEDLYLYRVDRDGSIMTESRKDNTKSLLSQLAILDSFKQFFKGIDNAFLRRLYGICSISFLIKYYTPTSLTTEKSLALLNENKKSIYKDMWRSQHWKMRVFMIFVICMPSMIIRKIIPVLDKNSKLM